MTIRDIRLLCTILAVCLFAQCAESTTGSDTDETDFVDLRDAYDIPPPDGVDMDISPPDILLDVEIDIVETPDIADISDMPAEETPCSPVGGACAAPADCCNPGGLTTNCLTDVATILVFPAGYCTAMCVEPGTCGTDSECVDFLSLIQYCMKKCSSSSDCRTDEGYICDLIPYISDPNTYCIPPV